MYSSYPSVFKYSEWRRASLLGLLLALCLPIMAAGPSDDDCVDEATYASVPLGPYLMMMPCPNDFDCDLVLDAVDEDDDNDGILDENECFGDPEITFEFQGTFGSIGPSPRGRDLQTPPGAGYTYASGGGLSAGQYIVSSQAGQDGSQFIHGNALLWPLSMTGHTDGSPTDAFLAVNGANAEGVFFEETVTLLAATDYEYGVWAINAGANGQISGLIPNIGIRLFDDQNQPVPGGQFSTGNLTLHEWTEAKGSFNTGANTEFRIEVFNISVGNSANDFAIDDVFFRRANFSTCNTDNMAGDNPQDLDSDDDGCFDVVEAGHADPDGDGILGTSPVMVDAQGRVTGQGGYTGGLFVTNDPNNDEACDCDIALGTTTPTDESCAGDADGEIAASASCSTCDNGINYSIAGPVNQSNTTGSFTGLTAGTYNVRVADADNGSCFAETQVILSNTDTQAPTLTCPASFAADLDLCGDYTLTAEALNLNATDNCGGAVTVTLSQTAFTGAGTTNVTVTVSDGTNSDNSCVVPVTLSVNPNAFSITTGADDLGDQCLNNDVIITAATLLGNDNASDGRNIEVQDVTLVNPAQGAIVNNNDGTFTFTPANGVSGAVAFEYLVTAEGDNLFFSGNGHYYDFVEAPGITWDDAKIDAEGRSLFGEPGYLVTITSQAEQGFVTTKLQGQGWMGATDLEVEGTWKWVVGPEAGTAFWQGQANGSAIGGAYTNWQGNEPNNLTSASGIHVNGEDYAHFRTNGQWNDFPLDLSGTNEIQGYVVEYGSNDCIPDFTATGNISLNLVDDVAPELNCKTSFDANLGINDMVTVSVSDLLDGATTDNCATTFTEAITGGDQTYGCGDVGAAAATLTVTVDDGNGNAAVSCDVTINVTDTNSECCSIAITSATPTDEGCPDADDGMIVVVATGATTIDYTLSGNGITPVTNQTGTFAGLADGTYDIAVADAADATCSASQTGVVVAAGTDTEAPTLTCPATFTSELDLCGEYTLTAEALNLNATDNCGGSVTIMLSQTAFTGAGTTNVTVTVSDGTNSDNSCVVAVTTTENTNAVNITAGADDLGTSCPVTAITFTNADLLANDNASDGSTLEIQEVSLANPADGTLTENNGTYTFTPAAGFTGTVNLNYLVTVQGSSLFFPDNGHFYVYVSDPGIHWSDARDDAANSTLFGLTGYLATVTSQAENDFILGKLQGQGWMGASDEGQEGVWLWVTGPEAGQQFWQGNQNGGPPASNPTAYNNWTVINGSQSEPNNFISFGLPENYGHFRVDGTWNDYKFSDGNINGYVIEYGENDCAQSLTATGSITLIVEDTEAPVLDCKTSFDANLGINDMVTVSVSDLLDGATTDNCATTFTEAITGGDQTYGCSDVGAAAATLTVTVDDGNGNAAVSCDVTINVTDTNSECNSAPTMTCAPVTVDADGNCMGAAAGADFVATSNDPDGDVLTFNVLPAGPYGIGETSVTVTADDGKGGTATCMTTISVVDNQLPNAACVEAVTVVLDDMGNGTLTVSDVNMGSTDNCGITGMSLNVTDFNCSDLDQGMNTGGGEVADYDVEELTPTANGPSFFAQTMVASVTGQLTSIEGLKVHNTVPGGVYPSVIELIEGHDPSGTVLYSENITATNTPTIFNLDLSAASITWTAGENYLLVIRILSGESISHAGTSAYQVGLGHNYANGRVFYFEDFTFLPIIGETQDIAFTLNVDTGAGASGPTTTLTVTDAAGNEASCETTVTVVDDMAPIANCQSALSIDLEVTESVTITPGMLDNGSSDNCTVNLAIDGGNPTYTCDDLGQTFTLQLNVTDGSNNSSTCTVDLTITDTNNECYTCDLGFSDGVDPNPPGIITSRIVCGNDGTITVNAFCNGCDDGNADLRYSISPDPNAVGQQTSNVFAGLTDGDYTVTILDVDHPDCNASTSATIGECVGEIPGNNIDDDCDTDTDEPSSIAWVLLDSGEGCTSNTDDCAGVFCYGLEYTPTVSGTLTSYTTGFLSSCIAGSTPLISNLSCVMDDNSFDADDCGDTGAIFFNSSGNNGTLELTKDMPVILHQICLSIPAETTLMLTKDEVTDITLSIDVTPILSTDDIIVATDRPDYTEATAAGNMPPAVTANAGAVDACYATVADAEAAALLATTATDDFTPVGSLVTTVATVGTCSATVTVTVEDACGLTTDVTYATRIDSDDPVITGTLETLTDEGCVAGDARAAADNVADLEAMGVAGFDIMDNCTDDATLAVTYADASTGTCPVVVTRTYTITDECGNSSTVEQTINVEDTTSPAVTGAITPTVLEGCDISVAPAAVSTVADLEGLLGDLLIEDACTDDATLAVTHEDVVGTACPIIITRTYTITDACTNFSEVVHTITIEDTVLPEITTTGTINACYTTVALAEAAALAAVSVTDNCDATITGVASTVGDCTATITINAQDACGNDAVPVTFNTQITGGAVPTEVGGPVAISADIQNTLDNVVPDAPVFEDVCGNTLTPSGPAIGGTYVEGTCEGTITYTYTYTDCAGTSVDWTFTYNVNCEGLRIKVYIEGGLNAGFNMLNTDYNENHLLPGQNNGLSPLFAVQIATPTPAGHPYGDTPWSFTDTDGTTYGDFAGQTAYPDHVADWVLVSVRMGSRAPAANVWQGAGWLHENGDVTFPEGSLANDVTLDAAETYYIVVEHRNHLPVLATATVQGSGANLYLEHDFTVADSYAPIFRFGQKEVAAGVFAMYAGNADQMSSRASINSSDRTGWRIDQTKVGYYLGDFNQNMTTNSEDETIWKINQNKTTGIIFD